MNLTYCDIKDYTLEIINYIEFDLYIKLENGVYYFQLIDQQKINLGDIMNEKFNNLYDVVEALWTYITDYILNQVELNYNNYLIIDYYTFLSTESYYLKLKDITPMSFILESL